MKHILTFLSLLLTASALSAAEFKPIKNAKGEIVPENKWYDSISIEPVGVLKQAGFSHGPSEYGAGVDLGLDVNKAGTISAHIRGLAYESNDHNFTMANHGKETGARGVRYEDDWGGSAIDEVSGYIRADILKSDNNRFILFGTGGGGYDLSHDDWFFGIGAGVEYVFTKNISVNATEELDAYFKQSKAWKTLVGVKFRF